MLNKKFPRRRQLLQQAAIILAVATIFLLMGLVISVGRTNAIAATPALLHHQAGNRASKLSTRHSSDRGGVHQHRNVSMFNNRESSVIEEGIYKSMPEVVMPYKYPMHQKLPNPRWKILEGIHNQHLRAQDEFCWSHSAEEPIFQSPPSFLSVERNSATASNLQHEFGYRDASMETFYSGSTLDKLNDQPGEANAGGTPWWVAATSGDEDHDNDLPCTAEVQARLYELQHPNKPCDKVRYLITKLKEGAHGVGSALTLVAHDLLSSIIVGRVLQLHTKSKWYFSSTHCASEQRGGWDCFFLPVSTCKARGDVEIVHHRRHALRSTASVILKKSFDIDGLSRNDIPSDELFFGPIRSSSCFPRYRKWIRNPANVYIQGTFERGADPALFYMLAQAMRYLMRAPQPWFRNMLAHHLPMVGITNDVMPNKNHNNNKETGAGGDPREEKDDGRARRQAIVYVQERGEIAKFREYYNVFGCHNINNSVFGDYIAKWCSNRKKTTEETPPPTEAFDCKVYISGNTPFKSYQQLALSLHKENSAIAVLSTWRHPSVAQGAETERWGASSPASSWIDMFAGVSSTNWVCIVQSNWCRVINLLRLTAGRASCGFVDGGALMIASSTDRQKYCIVGPYPTKAFSNRIK